MAAISKPLSTATWQKLRSWAFYPCTAHMNQSLPVARLSTAKARNLFLLKNIHSPNNLVYKSTYLRASVYWDSTFLEVYNSTELHKPSVASPMVHGVSVWMVTSRRLAGAFTGKIPIITHLLTWWQGWMGKHCPVKYRSYQELVFATVALVKFDTAFAFVLDTSSSRF